MTGKTRIRLTTEQVDCLSSASFDKAIYGERPSHRYSQMPNNGKCFDLRTVQSLERRGFLISDQKGGFLLTTEGSAALGHMLGYGENHSLPTQSKAPARTEKSAKKRGLRDFFKNLFRSKD